MSYRYHEPTTESSARLILVNFNIGTARWPSAGYHCRNHLHARTAGYVGLRLEKAKRDLQQLLGKVSKLVQ